MKQYRFRIVISILLILFFVYLLYPTFRDYLYTKQFSEELKKYELELKEANPEISASELKLKLKLKEDSLKTDENYKRNRTKRLKLGLDLQGGMYVVMEVNVLKLLEKLANKPDAFLREALEHTAKITSENDVDAVNVLVKYFQDKGVRLSKYYGSIRETDEEIASRLKKQTEDAVTRAMEIIRNRVDQYGVSEPSIQKQGSRRIVVELPGIAKEEEAKQLLQGSALLEFKIVKDADVSIPIMNRIDEILANRDPQDTTKLYENASEEEIKKRHPFFSVARIASLQDPRGLTYVREDQRDILLNYLKRPEVQNVIPNNLEFLLSAKPEFYQDGYGFYGLYLVNKEPELTGGVIVDAQANIDPQTSSPIVTMQMNSEGAREWARITGSNIEKRCAIVLDGVVYSAPTIKAKIPTGNSQITGMKDLDEAKLLQIVLKAGALPAPIDIIEERTVGPSLGQDSISKGATSLLLGFLLVALFMSIYYQKAGIISASTLIITVLFIIAILAGFQGTLTMPGIAGIILTIGMAVDANILIFERIREELKTGKSVKTAIESGYLNSYSAIFDSNITTFFTGIILYQFGSGPIQGFALTLMIGIIASLFSALVITRVILSLSVEKTNKISIG